jgi:phage terminase large subunit
MPMHKHPYKANFPEPEVWAKMPQAERLLFWQYMALYVSERFEEWRGPHRYKIAYGGRGAGGKSWNAASLLVQKAEIEQKRILCVREVQKSIEESSYRLIKDTVARLGFRGWTCGKSIIRNDKNGSYFVYNGLNDMVADDIKSYESFDILFAEEAAPISMNSWNTILPTFRKKGSEIWALFNRDLERDPVYELFCVKPFPDSSIIDCRPCELDNEWWYETELPALAEKMKADDPDEYEHVFLGQPRKQTEKAAIARIDIRGAMDRNIENPEGATEIGVDVARFGDDSTQMFKRKGLKVIGGRSMKKADTIAVAQNIWDFAGQDKTIKIKIDEGYNPGVVDLVKSYGGNVIAVNFGGKPSNKEMADKYTSAADEMWFEFPIDDADIPDDPELMAELSDRRYGYEKGTNRKKIESKDDYKKRHGGKSPDKADALLLTYYEPHTETFNVW